MDAQPAPRVARPLCKCGCGQALTPGEASDPGRRFKFLHRLAALQAEKAARAAALAVEQRGHTPQPKGRPRAPAVQGQAKATPAAKGCVECKAKRREWRKTLGPLTVQDEEDLRGIHDRLHVAHLEDGTTIPRPRPSKSRSRVGNYPGQDGAAATLVVRVKVKEAA